MGKRWLNCPATWHLPWNASRLCALPWHPVFPAGLSQSPAAVSDLVTLSVGPLLSPPPPPRLPGVPSDLNHLLTREALSLREVLPSLSDTVSAFPNTAWDHPQNIHIVTQRTCECGALHGKGNFADIIKLKDLRWVIPEVHPNWELGEGLPGAVAKPGLNALVPRAPWRASASRLQGHVLLCA